jgi:hypothetical protein
MTVKVTATILTLLLCTVLLTGCNSRSLPAGAKILINVPTEPPPGGMIKVITLDVEEGRGVFIDFFRTTRRIGMCNPSKLKKDNSAHKVMTISYWGPGFDFIFYILKNDDGHWIDVGYGGVEVYDVPEGFPKYRYSGYHLVKVKKWYEKHVPQEDRHR